MLNDAAVVRLDGATIWSLRPVAVTIAACRRYVACKQVTNSIGQNNKPNRKTTF